MTLGSASAFAGECTIKSLSMNFVNEVDGAKIVSALAAKGYDLDYNSENGLFLAVGFGKEGMIQRESKCAISNAVTAVGDAISYAVKRKRSEEILISKNGKLLFSHYKKLGALASNTSRVDKLIEQIPKCRDL